MKGTNGSKMTPLRYCQICSSLTDRGYTAPGGAMVCQRCLAELKPKTKTPWGVQGASARP